MSTKPLKKATAKKSAYARSGVDIALGNKVKSGLGSLVKSTHRPEVLSAIGGFGGLFDARFRAYKYPVLVTSIDGVGTKLKVAAMAGKHEGIGQDLVNHCVDDIAVLGAEPLFFLDYIGTSNLDPQRFKEIVRGLTKACKQAGCTLIGGETAQMPGIYHGDDYDLVGTIVGVVDKEKMITGNRSGPGMSSSACPHPASIPMAIPWPGKFCLKNSGCAFKTMFRDRKSHWAICCWPRMSITSPS
jgi:phosphoribosylformylglycinamidine cyclo-ligase